MQYHARAQRRIQRAERIGRIREKLDTLKKPAWSTVSAKVIDVPREFACQLKRLELEEIERTLSDELDRLEEEEDEDRYQDEDDVSSSGWILSSPPSSVNSISPPGQVAKIKVSNHSPLLPRVVSVVDPLEREPSSSVFSAGPSSFLRKSDGSTTMHSSGTGDDPMIREERNIAAKYRAIALETASLPKTSFCTPASASASMTDLRRTEEPSSQSLPASIDEFIRQGFLKQRAIPQHIMLAEDLLRPKQEVELRPKRRHMPPILPPGSCSVPTAPATPNLHIIPRPVFARRDSEPITSSCMGGQRLQRSLESQKPHMPSSRRNPWSTL